MAVSRGAGQLRKLVASGAMGTTPSSVDSNTGAENGNVSPNDCGSSTGPFKAHRVQGSQAAG